MIFPKCKMKFLYLLTHFWPLPYCVLLSTNPWYTLTRVFTTATRTVTFNNIRPLLSLAPVIGPREKNKYQNIISQSRRQDVCIGAQSRRVEPSRKEEKNTRASSRLLYSRLIVLWPEFMTGKNIRAMKNSSDKPAQIQNPPHKLSGKGCKAVLNYRLFFISIARFFFKCFFGR